MPEPVDRTAELLGILRARGFTLGVAESLTGGELTAELTRPAGASAVVNGGVVVYATEIKHAVVGVDAALLAEHGPVHPEVARQLARGIRDVLSVGGKPADVGVSTTGVAGPDPQGGQPVGTVHLGISIGNETRSATLHLTGDRAGIRRASVQAAIETLLAALAE